MHEILKVVLFLERWSRSCDWPLKGGHDQSYAGTSVQPQLARHVVPSAWQTYERCKEIYFSWPSVFFYSLSYPWFIPSLHLYEMIKQPLGIGYETIRKKVGINLEFSCFRTSVSGQLPFCRSLPLHAVTGSSAALILGHHYRGHNSY